MEGWNGTEERDTEPAWRTWEELAWEVTVEYSLMADFLVESRMEGGKACLVKPPAGAKARRQDHCMSTACRGWRSFYVGFRHERKLGRSGGTIAEGPPVHAGEFEQ